MHEDVTNQIRGFIVLKCSITSLDLGSIVPSFFLPGSRFKLIN